MAEGGRWQLWRKADALRAFRCENCERLFVVDVYVRSGVVSPASQVRHGGNVVGLDQCIRRCADTLYQLPVVFGHDFGECRKNDGLSVVLESVDDRTEVRRE